MMLMPKYLEKDMPSLYSAEQEKDPVVKCKFFMPMTKWYWYGIEFDGKDTFFGYVVGEFPELGYFSLSSLQELEGPYGVGVERDLFFESAPLSEIRKLHE